MKEVVPSAMSGLITTIGEVLTAFLSWLGNMLTFVNGQPMLQVFVVLAIVGVALRYLRKWLPGL